MDRFERDPEAATLALLRASVPRVDHIAQESGILLDATPAMLLSCSDIWPADMNTIACAYNNLMALYGRGRPRAVSVHRFLHQNPRQFSLETACDEHTAVTLLALAQRTTRQHPGKRPAVVTTFFTYANAYTLVEDVPTAWIPRDPFLRAIMRMFEASVQYTTTLRRCEVIARRGQSTLMVVDREFASTSQYERAVSAWRGELEERARAVTARRIGCVACCPCVATEVLSFYPSTLTLPYIVEIEEKPTREDLVRERFITTSFLESGSLAERQNAILWFFSGTTGPLQTLFSVVSRLRGGSVDDALGLVQEVALRNWRRYRETPEEARRQQQTLVAPALRVGQLYSPADGAVISDCSVAPRASASPFAGHAARDRTAVGRTPPPRSPRLSTPPTR